MGWLKLTVRTKILATIAFVAAVVLALGAVAAFGAVNAANQRGQYLKESFERYVTNIKEGGDPEAAVVTLMAGDPELQLALSENDTVQIKRAAERLGKNIQGNLAPDRVILSDATGDTYPVAGFDGLSSGVWRTTRMFKDLRSGKSFSGEFAIMFNVPFRVAGVPVKDRTGKVVGTLLIGRRLQKLFDDVSRQSESNKYYLRYRFALVGPGKVLAEALNDKVGEPEALLAVDEVLREDPDGGAHEMEGGWLFFGGNDVPVLRLPDDRGGTTTFDYWVNDLKGYNAGVGDVSLGRLYLVRSRDDRMHRVDAIYSSLGLLFAVTMLGALIVGWVVAVQITRPIRSYIQATETLSRGEGDLTQRLPVASRDELGDLARNLNRVFAKIHTLAAGVQNTAFQVNASSGEISAVSKQMLAGAKEQAGKVGNSTAAVTELSSSIQQVAENAAEASRTAKASGEAVTDAIQRLQQIRYTVEDAASRIEALGESGKRIGNIVEVIRQISEQTTMLALNAAIEAAHAGEHGRGFAVVADEVSSLAKRVGQSARDIEDLIATIRDQTGEAVNVMQTGTREVEEGTTLVEATLGDLHTLITVVDDTAAAVQEQAIASDEIARNMDAVSRIAGEVVDSSENAVSQGDHLQSLASELESSVKGFKIDPERVALDEQELKALPPGR